MMPRQASPCFSLAAAAILLVGVTAAAQQPGTMGGTPGQPQQQVPGQPSNPEYPTTMSTTGTPADNPEIADQAFMRETLQDNQAQVAMSQLAQQKASSDDVKEFGQQMVQIHTQLTDQLMPVAKQLGVNQPDGPTKNQKKEIAKLQSLSGSQFDSAYIQAMAKQQQENLKRFQQEEKTAQNPNVQQAAKMDTPVLSQHLEVLQKIAQSHNVTIASR